MGHFSLDLPHTTLFPQFDSNLEFTFLSVCLVSRLHVHLFAASQLKRNEPLVGRRKERKKKTGKEERNVFRTSGSIQRADWKPNMTRLIIWTAWSGERNRTRKGEKMTLLFICLVVIELRKQKMCKENFKCTPSAPQSVSHYASNKVNKSFSQMLTLVLLQAKADFLCQVAPWNVYPMRGRFEQQWQEIPILKTPGNTRSDAQNTWIL